MRLLFSVETCVSRVPFTMGRSKNKKTQKFVRRKFAAVKKIINPKDMRIKSNQVKAAKAAEEKEKKKVRCVTQVSSALFFKYNTQLGPPYRVLIDTNFVNFAIRNKIDLTKGMMDCLYAKCIPCVTECVIGELEKMGSQYRVALRLLQDPSFERLPCYHKGTYADDCLIDRIMKHKCYIVATCDRDLKRRIRKVPGVPIMYISQHRFTIERMPDDFGAPR